MGTRSTPILKGASLNDTVVIGVFTYYGFTRSDNTWVVMRVNATETQYRYTVGGPAKDLTYAQASADFSALNYTTSDKYKY